MPEDAVEKPQAGESGFAGGQGGVTLALELAKSRGEAPDWEVSFELARLLRTISKDDPMRFQPAVEAFCEATGRPYREFVYAYLDAWPRVIHDEDAFDWAVRQARISPYVVSPCPTEDYATVASIAYHLGRRLHPKPFFLPVKKLAEVVDMSAMGVSRLLKVLQSNGVIECIDVDYSYRDGKAKEYVFLGAPSSVVEAATVAAA